MSLRASPADGRRTIEPSSPTPKGASSRSSIGGRSNKEVAAALFLSVKTVEVTLTRVYRKLGVRSRTELAARLAEDAKD